jgi:hypothetical protein
MPMIEQLPRTGKGFAGPNTHYDEFRQLLYPIVAQQHPITVRGTFYRAVVKNYVYKTDYTHKEFGNGYGIIQGELVKMRKSGMIPYDWIVDESRSVRGTQGTNQRVEDFLDGLIERIPNDHYVDLLADHDFSIQVWIEKEALAGVIEPVTIRWGVPLIPAKGYASLSLLYEAGQDLERKDRPAKIFHLGDFDPSGQNAIETVQRDLLEHAPKTARLGFEFHTIALNLQQIEEMNLPTRPTKASDPRAARFGSDISVELDAVEPNILRQMVDEALAACFPPGAREARRARQEAEREQIRQWLADRLRTDEDDE